MHMCINPADQIVCDAIPLQYSFYVQHMHIQFDEQLLL